MKSINSWMLGWWCAFLFSFLAHVLFINDVIRQRAYTFGACRVTCGDQSVEVQGNKCYCIDTAGVKTPKEIPKYPE